MKKQLLLGSALVMAGFLNAQTYFTEDFSGGIGQFTTTDADGDGQEWLIYDDATNFPAQGNVISSASWNSSPLTPDNWLISSAIDLTSAAGVVSLEWKVRAQDQGWVLENYDVYVSAGNTPAALTASGSVFNEVLTTSAGYMNRTLDISAFIGQTVHIGFRHHDCTDAFRMNLDNIVVKTPLNDDAALTSATIDGLGEGARTVDVEVTNNGGNNITAFDMEWTFNGGSATTENVTGINLAPGQTNIVNVSLGNLTIGSYAFTAEVTTVNGGADGAPGDNSISETYTIVETIPNWTLTDSYGTTHTMHDVLAQGQMVILDFFASWCGPCESSTPELNTLYVNNGSGSGPVQVFGITVEANDNDAVVNGLGWGATYPKFSYTPECDAQYAHYASTLGLNPDGYIPFFVMICPDINNPGASTIVQSDAGFLANMFSNSYEPKISTCATATYDATSMKEVNNDFSLAVFPNPVNNLATIQLNLDNAAETVIELTNMLGQVVYTSNKGELFGQQNITLDCSTYDNGIYLVNVTANGITNSQRIVLSK